MAERKVSTTVYLTEDQNKVLKMLSKRTKAPVSTFIREGVDLVLKKYEEDIPGQGNLFE